MLEEESVDLTSFWAAWTAVRPPPMTSMRVWGLDFERDWVRLMAWWRFFHWNMLHLWLLLSLLRLFTMGWRGRGTMGCPTVPVAMMTEFEDILRRFGCSWGQGGLGWQHDPLHSLPTSLSASSASDSVSDSVSSFTAAGLLLLSLAAVS